jgi:hypothetical protein
MDDLHIFWGVALLNLTVSDESNNAYREEGGKTIVVQCKSLNVITLGPRETEHNIRINFIRTVFNYVSVCRLAYAQWIKLTD